MNFNILLGRCMQIIGKAREYWGRLTHNELSRVSGQQLVIFGQMRVAGGLAEVLRAQGIDVVVTREPGAGDAGMAIREILLHGEQLDPKCELLLYLADRAQHGGIAEGSRVAVHLKFEAFAAHAFGGIDGEDQLEVNRFCPGRQDEQQEEQDPNPDHSVLADRRGGSAEISAITLPTIASPN